MDANNIYNNYDQRVQDYMKNVIECLEQDYGKIPESWRVSLDLIADNYSIYLQAKDNINENGLLKKDPRGYIFKNQCVSIMNSAQTQLKDLLKSFALTPMSKSKMKQLDIQEEENEDDYLNDLGYE